MNYSVHVDGLNAIKNSDSLTIIFGDIGRSSNAVLTLQNFINDNTTLQGEHWDKMRLKLGNYQSAFNKRSEAATILVDAINRAVQLLLDYLGDDIYLDPAELVELKSTVVKCEQQIDTLEEMIVATKTETVTNLDGTTSSITVSVYSEAEKANFRRQINELNDLILECKRLIAKIEGLEAVYNQAIAILSEAEPSLNELKEIVSSIIPSEKVYYNPA